jgi:hypothetical protein
LSGNRVLREIFVDERNWDTVEGILEIFMVSTAD